MASARIDRRQRMAEQTRREILEAARRLFAERGYVATSVTDIAEEAGVAVQTIYARLGSKRGMLMGLIDLIDEEAGVADLGAGIASARTPTATLRAEVGLGAAVREGQRRHREGARVAVERLAELRGLRDDVTPDQAAAVIALSTNHEAWHELVDAHGLSWDDAEAVLTGALGRALLKGTPPSTRG